MRTLTDHIRKDARLRQTERASQRGAPRTVSEDAGEVRVIKSLGLEAATVAQPACISLEDRAARMNDFWRALVDFQHRDVLVVAPYTGYER